MFWFTIGVFVFIFALAISIALHEYGHLFVAKKLGLKVPQFFVGFGKTIYSKEKNGTEYGVKLLPLGGFVRILDPKQKSGSIEETTLSHVKPWKRQLVFAAGPMVNIVLGLAICFSLFMATNVNYYGNTIESINNCNESVDCGASKTNIKIGDTVIKVNGENVSPEDSLHEIIGSNKTTEISVLRGKEIIENISVETPNGFLGVKVMMESRSRTFTESIKESFSILTSTVQSIKEVPNRLINNIEIIFGNERKDDSLAGMVSVAGVYGQITETSEISTSNKAQTLIYYTGMFNIGLGIINLLPIMPLDGGRMFFAFLDTCKNAFRRNRDYSPVNQKFANIVASIGAVTIFIFMFIVLASDFISPIVIF